MPPVPETREERSSRTGWLALALRHTSEAPAPRRAKKTREVSCTRGERVVYEAGSSGGVEDCEIVGEISVTCSGLWTTTPTRVRRLPRCDNSLDGKRSDAKTCSTPCRKRLERQTRRPHPYRNTPQYKQARDMWPEYVGYHWLPDGLVLRRPGGQGLGVAWDRRLRQTGFEYGTAY